MKYRIVVKPETAARLKRWGLVSLGVGAGGGLLGGVFVVSFYMAMKVEMRSSEVVVPDFHGLGIEKATRVADPLGLVLDVVDRRHDPAVASGKVLQQQPASGARVRHGRKIKLILSLGGKILTVPALVGKADRAVEIELRRDGFGLGDEARVASGDVPAGRILAQVPPEGSPGVPSTRVHRLVSDGPPVKAWVMPDLTGLPRRVAERWIDRSGFRRGPVRQIAVRGRTSGTIVGQSPLAGYPIRRNDIVDLTVAR
jgi:serine/threonine-protein kinase